jgi:hypothetical protein
MVTYQFKKDHIPLDPFDAEEEEDQFLERLNKKKISKYELDELFCEE